MAGQAGSDSGEMQGMPGGVLQGVVATPAVAASVDCPTCGQSNPQAGGLSNPTSWVQPVYAIGRLSPYFPTVGVEQEFAQLTAGVHHGDDVEVNLLQQILGDPDNAYFGRHLGWVFASQNVQTFTVVPRHDADVARLAEVVAPAGADEVVHVVVGTTVPSPSGSASSASALPSVNANQVLAFTLGEFAAAVTEDEAPDEKTPPADAGSSRAGFESLVRSVFLRLTGGPANHGFTEEDRALNFTACRVKSVYHAVWDAHHDGKVLIGIDTRHIHSPDRRIVSVGLTFRHPRTQIIERLYGLFDVTEELIFMVGGLTRG